MKHTGRDITIIGTVAPIAPTNREQSLGPTGMTGGKQQPRKMEVQKMKPVISTRIVDQNPVHIRIKVWNRGGLAGTLVVNTADAVEIIGRLQGAPAHIRQVVVEQQDAPPLAL